MISFAKPLYNGKTESAVDRFIAGNFELKDADLLLKWETSILNQKINKKVLREIFEDVWAQQPWSKTDKQRAFKKFESICKKQKIKDVRTFAIVITEDMWARHNFVNGRKGSWKQKFVTYLDSRTWEDEDMPTVFDSFDGSKDTTGGVFTDELMHDVSWMNDLSPNRMIQR